MAKFSPRVTEEEIRSARRRIAAGESKRSVARLLGYSGSSPHKALQQRMDAQERRDDFERLERQTRVATAEAEKKRIARGVRTGYGQVQRTTEAPEHGRTFPDRYAEAHAAISAEADQAARRRAQAAADDAAAAAERADRRRRFGFQPNGGKVYRDPEAQWLQESEDARAAMLAHQVEHPEVLQRHAYFTLDDRQVGRSPAGLTTDDLEAKALRLSSQHGPVEYRPLP